MVRSASKQVVSANRADVMESCGMHGLNVGAGRLRQKSWIRMKGKWSRVVDVLIEFL